MVTTTNLISYYKLDTDADDAHGSNDGTVSGATLTTGDGGIIDEGYDFELADNGDYIDLGLNFGDELSLSDDISVSLWFKAESQRGNSYEGSLFGNEGSGGGNFVLSTGNSQIYAFARNASSQTVSTSAGSISTSTWHHVVMVYDQDSLKVYLDGNTTPIIDGSFATPGSLLSKSPNANFWLGNNEKFATTREFDGVIDEVGVWNRALTSSEVSDLYNSGSGLAYPFSSGTTVSPSTLTLSMDEQSPAFFLDIMGGALSLTSSLKLPSLTIPKTFYPDTVPLIMTLKDVTVGLPVEVMTGTIGTKWINTNYPIEEGLTAYTTRQTGNPNLVPTEETSF